MRGAPFRAERAGHLEFALEHDLGEGYVARHPALLPER